jgi:hypothetical protein
VDREIVAAIGGRARFQRTLDVYPDAQYRKGAGVSFMLRCSQVDVNSCIAQAIFDGRAPIPRYPTKAEGEMTNLQDASKLRSHTSRGHKPGLSTRR